MSRYRLVGTKDGLVQKNNIKKNIVKAIALSFGVVSIGSAFTYHENYINNKNTDTMINNVASTYQDDYSKALTDMLGVNIPEADVELVNTFCEYLREIDEYEKVGVGVDKHFLPIAGDVSYRALKVLKEGIAKDNNITSNIDKNVKVYVGLYGNKVSVNRDGMKKTYSLSGDAGRLSVSISALQDYSETFPTKSDANMKTYNNAVRNVIIDTIKYVDSREHYKIPIHVGGGRVVGH